VGLFHRSEVLLQQLGLGAALIQTSHAANHRPRGSAWAPDRPRPGPLRPRPRALSGARPSPASGSPSVSCSSRAWLRSLSYPMSVRTGSAPRRRVFLSELFHYGLERAARGNLEPNARARRWIVLARQLRKTIERFNADANVTQPR
jgi:hypothetical protein